MPEVTKVLLVVLKDALTDVVKVFMRIVELTTLVVTVATEFTDEASVSTVWNCITAESVEIGPAALLGGPPTTHPLLGEVI